MFARDHQVKKVFVSVKQNVQSVSHRNIIIKY